MNADEQTEALETAIRRRDLLDALVDGPLPKRDLVDRLDVSRSTVDRVVRRLERQGFVERCDDGWRLTHSGRLMASLAGTLRDAAADVAAARPVIDALPLATPVTLDLVADATVLPATSPAPHRPLERVLALLDESTRYHGLAVAVTESRFPRAFHDRVVDAGADGELVFEAPLVESVLADQTDLVGRMVEAGFTPLVTESVPCGLLLLDTADGARVAVSAYDADGGLVGVLLNDSRPALAWGERLYRAYRARAADISAAF